MPHPNSLANLKPPWEPGNINPGAGRPRKRAVSEAYDELLETKAPDEFIEKWHLKKGATWADVVAMAMVRKAAMKGDPSAAKELREATEGKAPQRIEISSHQKRESLVTVTYADGPTIDVTPKLAPGDQDGDGEREPRTHNRER